MKRLPWVSLVLLLVCYAGFGWYLSGLKTQPTWMRSACERVFAPVAYSSSGSQEVQSPSLTSSVKAEVTPSETGSSQLTKPTADSSTTEPSVTTRSESSRPKSTLPEPNSANQTEEPTEARPKSDSSKTTIAEPNPPGETEKSTLPGKKPEKERETSFICGIVVRHNIHVGLLAIAWIFLSSMAFISPLTSFSGFISRWFRSDTVAFMTIVTIAGMAAVILYWLHVFLQILTILAADALARIDIQTAGLSGNHAFRILVLVSLTGLIAGWLLNVFLV